MQEMQDFAHINGYADNAWTVFEVAQYAYNDWHDTEWPDADATSH